MNPISSCSVRVSGFGKTNADGSNRNKVFDRTRRLIGNFGNSNCAAWGVRWWAQRSGATHTKHVATAKPWPCWNYQAASWALVPVARSNDQQSCSKSCSNNISERFHCQQALTCFRWTSSGCGLQRFAGSSVIDCRGGGATHPEHRDHRAHRCGQDYHYGAHLVPHREDHAPGATSLPPDTPTRNRASG